MLLVVDFRRGAGNHEAEVARDRPGEVEVRTGQNGVLEPVLLRVRRAVERELLMVAHEVDAPAELPAAALEGTLADEIHGATERVGGVGRRGDLGQLDAGNVVERHRAHIDGARGAGPDVGGGRAVGGDRGHRATEAAHRDPRDVGIVEIGREPGHEFQKLSDAPAEHVAERVGREDVLQVRSEALFVGRDGLGVGLFVGRHDEGVQFHRRRIAPVALRTRKLDVMLDRAAVGHRDADDHGIEVGVEKLHDRGASRDADELVGAEVVGEHDLVTAAQRDPGLVEVLAGDDILHAAGDRAGGGERDTEGEEQPGRGQPAKRSNHGVGVTFYSTRARSEAASDKTELQIRRRNSPGREAAARCRYDSMRTQVALAQSPPHGPPTATRVLHALRDYRSDSLGWLATPNRTETNPERVWQNVYGRTRINEATRINRCVLTEPQLNGQQGNKRRDTASGQDGKIRKTDRHDSLHVCLLTKITVEGGGSFVRLERRPNGIFSSGNKVTTLLACKFTCEVLDRAKFVGAWKFV